MSGHTPGPWRLHAVDDCTVIDATDAEVACVCGDYNHPDTWPQMEANARLIAAAPDLLSIAKRWAALDGGAWHPERHASEKAELLADTRAALAKATERTP